MFRPRRTYAIGDTHGHYEELMKLWEQLLRDGPMDLSQDMIIFLGDMVDVGDDARAVVQQIMGWQQEYNKAGEPHVIALKGNHEDLLLDALDPKHPQYSDPTLWLDQGGSETLKSYNPKLKKLSKRAFEKARKTPETYLDEKHIKWIKELPYIYMDADFIFVHGGLPNEPLESILTKLNDEDNGMQQTLIWIRNDFIFSSYSWGKRVIFAHTPTMEPIVMGNKIGINTLPRNEGKLTAIEIPSMRFFYQAKL